MPAHVSVTPLLSCIILLSEFSGLGFPILDGALTTEAYAPPNPNHEFPAPPVLEDSISIGKLVCDCPNDNVDTKKNKRNEI